MQSHRLASFLLLACAMPRVYGSDGAAVGQLFHAIDALGKSGVADDVFSRGQIKEGLLRGAPRGAVAARATAPRAAAAAVPHVGGGGGAAATCNNVGPYLLKGAVLASHDSHTRGACCELCTRSNQCSGYTFEQMSDVCTLVSGQLIIDFEVEQKGIVSGSVVGREFGMDHDAAKDCAMIGMAAAHCNPTIAKVFAHTQFPANGCAGGITPIPVRQDCGEGPTMYESWATNGFGSDNRVFLPSIMSAAIELRRPAVFMTPRGREWQSIFWLFNKKSNANVVVEDDFCPHKTYYDCYFKPATTCALDARCPASAVDNYRAFECQPEEFIKPANDLTAFLQKQPGGVCGSSQRADGAGRRATTRPPTQKEIDAVKAIAAKALTAEGMKGGGPYEIHTAALFFQLNTKMQGYVADQKRKIGFTGKRIGVQIRHSDFVIEHPETRVETYCIIVARMMELSGINGIYLATDDPQITPQSFTKCVVNAGRAVLQIKLDASKISVVSQKWKRGVGSTEDQAARNGANAFALAALTDLILLGDCDALVISGGSSFSHLSMVLAVTKGRAKHFHVVDCAGADVKELVALRQLEAKLTKHDAAKGGVSWQLADARKDIEVLTGESALLNMLELANFHNYYSPKAGIDACHRAVKVNLFTHPKCDASLNDPSLRAHFKAPIELRLPYGGKAAGCVADVLLYTPVVNQCKKMCNLAKGMSCTFLVPRSRVVQPAAFTGGWSDAKNPGPDGCVTVERISLDDCAEWSNQECTESAYAGLGPAKFKCKIKAFDRALKEKCKVSVYSNLELQ